MRTSGSSEANLMSMNTGNDTKIEGARFFFKKRMKIQGARKVGNHHCHPNATLDQQHTSKAASHRLRHYFLEAVRENGY